MATGTQKPMAAGW
jgi:hypothetical protein